MRQFNRKYAKNPGKEAQLKLIKANEINFALASIAEYRVKGFKEALVIKKSKKRQGKKLNLIGEPYRQAQFFGIAKVLAAMRQEDKKVKKAE